MMTQEDYMFHNVCQIIRGGGGKRLPFSLNSSLLLDSEFAQGYGLTRRFYKAE